MRTLVIIALLGWTAWRLADVERQRYALAMGLCTPQEVSCDVQSRTSWGWNLWYGLMP